MSFIRLKKLTHLGSSDAVNLVIPCHRISPGASFQVGVLLSLYVGSKVQQVYCSGAEREGWPSCWLQTGCSEDGQTDPLEGGEELKHGLHQEER